MDKTETFLRDLGRDMGEFLWHKMEFNTDEVLDEIYPVLKKQLISSMIYVLDGYIDSRFNDLRSLARFAEDALTRGSENGKV